MGLPHKKEQSFWNSGGFSFGLTLISVSLVFIFLGYVMGQYAVQYVSQQPKEEANDITQVNQEIDRGLDELSNEQETDVSVVAPSNSQAQVEKQKQEVNDDMHNATDTLYRVQVGAFSQRENAEAMVAMLQDKGYEAIILTGPPFRVQTGAFSILENAEQYQEQLEAEGFEVMIVN